MSASVDRRERFIAAGQQTQREHDGGLFQIVSNFNSRISENIGHLLGNGGKSRLAYAEEVIRRWSDSHLPWEDSPDKIAEYLSAVDDVISLSEAKRGDVDRAANVLRMAMEKLQEELRHLVIQNAAPIFETSRILAASFASESVVSNDGYFSCAEDEEDTYAAGKSFRGSFSEDLPIGAIKPFAIPLLQSIVERMIRGRYNEECCQVYCGVRIDLFDGSIAKLGIKKMNIEEVQMIEWDELDAAIDRWLQVLNIVFESLLAGEKNLCDQIFEISPVVGGTCFAETTKGILTQLLNFAEAVTIGESSPEKLFKFLDMYDALSSVMPDFQGLFPEEQREFLHEKAELLLKKLRLAAKETLEAFKSAAHTHLSRRTDPSGIHPLTRYVMNYLTSLMECKDTVNELLSERDFANAAELKNVVDPQFSGTMWPLGRYVNSIVSFLESNIEEMSKLHEDIGLRFVFLINNTQYLVEKVKGGELQSVLGDNWIRKRHDQIRQHSWFYLRASWISMRPYIKEDGLGSWGAGNGGRRGNAKEPLNEIRGILSFAEAVTTGENSPQKLYKLLQMYDALSRVMPELELLFPKEEDRQLLYDRAKLILRRLGDAAKEILEMFENAVQTEASRKVDSGIHPLTCRVIDYLKFLVDYEGTLNKLLGDAPELKSEDDHQFSGTVPPLGRHVISIISFLDSSIEEKSKLHKDPGLRFVFLMNNMLYMVNKVNDGELRSVLGDEWVRERRGQIRQHSLSYLRASWFRLISFVTPTPDGLSGYRWSAVSERLKNFNAAFEEVCRNQSTWIVEDPRLRDDLRILISDILIPAYRSFMGRFGWRLEGSRNGAKYAKYTAEDLERCLSSLFEGPSFKDNRRKKLLEWPSSRDRRRMNLLEGPSSSIFQPFEEKALVHRAALTY